MSYNWQAVASELSPNIGHLFGFSRNNCVGVAHIVRADPDYSMYVLQAVTSLLGTNCVYVEVQLSISLLTWFT